MKRKDERSSVETWFTTLNLWIEDRELSRKKDVVNTKRRMK
jgi:hypothetical protein